MSFNDWLSSSSVSRQPLSTTTNFNEMKLQHDHYHYHHHYHYHYPAMTTATIAHPLYIHCQHQCHQKQESSNPLALVPSMPMIDNQVPLKYKENIHQNSTLKLRRCAALFLHLIGINFI